MATKLYISDLSAPGYTPATLRGAWDATAGENTRALVSALNGEMITSLARSEASATNFWDVLLLRGVSRPLSGDQTISGTLTLILGAYEAYLDANFFYHVHAYVTQGESDTPRGTLITDSIGASEWPNTVTDLIYGAGLTTGAVALNAVNALSGDRIVVEIGYQAQNTSTASYLGLLYYGNPVGASDLPDADTAVTTKAGTLTFSGDLAFTEAKRRATAAWAEVDITAGANAKRRATAAYAEIDITAGANAKRRATAVWVEVDIGYLTVTAIGPPVGAQCI